MIYCERRILDALNEAPDKGVGGLNKNGEGHSNEGAPILGEKDEDTAKENKQ